MRKTSKFLFIFLVILFACGKKELKKHELEAHLYDESNGLTVKKVVKDFLLEVTYRPTELVWMNDLEQLDKSKQDSLLQHYQDRYYFVAAYSMPDHQDMDPLSRLAQDKALYREVLSELSFRFHQRVSMVLKDGEEINAVGSFFSKSYGMTPTNLVLFFFEDKRLKEEKELTVSIEDVGFGIGVHSFNFLQSDIRNTPHLVL